MKRTITWEASNRLTSSKKIKLKLIILKFHFIQSKTSWLKQHQFMSTKGLIKQGIFSVRERIMDFITKHDGKKEHQAFETKKQTATEECSRQAGKRR